MSLELFIWVEAICTLAIFSFLFRENPIYRLFEHTFLGLTIGFVLMKTWLEVLKPKWWDRLIYCIEVGDPHFWIWIIAFILGMMWYFQLSRRWYWVSRIAIGISLGVGAGMEFKNQFMLIMPQITASFKPILVRNAQKMLQFSFNNFFMVFTIVAVLSYFFFSFEFKYKGIKFLPRAGRLLLMISFGAFFGNTVMTRFAVFIDRIQFLIQQWLHIGGG